jgi:hypothetical protein
MSPSEIDELIEVDPFHPFRVTLASGDQYVVNNRFRTFISGLSLVVGLADDPEDRMDKRLKLISIPNIVMAELINLNQPPHRRRRRK